MLYNDTYLTVTVSN